MLQTQLNLDEFSQAMASTKPSPGGGGAAAYCGALSAALISMVSSLSADKLSCVDYADELKETAKEAEVLRARLVELVDQDEKGFLPLSEAWAMPMDTTAEREERSRLIQAALVTACDAPLEMMRLCVRCTEVLNRLAKIANRTVISDVGVGAMMAAAAIRAASVNVFINISMLKDEALAAEMQETAEALLKDAKKGDRVFKKVLDALKA